MAAGCGGCGVGASAGTRLVISRVTGADPSLLLPSQATLSCDGTAHATGFLQNAAGPACAFVARGLVQRVVAHQRSRRVCSQIYGGPQHAHLTGTVGGQDVKLT